MLEELALMLLALKIEQEAMSQVKWVASEAGKGSTWIFAWPEGMHLLTLWS
jgi:hypothetical protein